MGCDAGEHHERPATLAVADDERLFFGVRVQLAHFLQKRDFCGRHCFDGLARQRLGKERHEITRMCVLQRDADLAVHLEAADAGAVACARVDDDERTLVRIGRGVTCRHPELHERVIRGPLELASIEDHVVFEDEHRRLPGLLVLDVIVAAVAQHIGREDRALPCIDPVFHRGHPCRTATTTQWSGNLRLASADAAARRICSRRRPAGSV